MVGTRDQAQQRSEQAGKLLKLQERTREPFPGAPSVFSPVTHPSGAGRTQQLTQMFPAQGCGMQGLRLLVKTTEGRDSCLS